MFAGEADAHLGSEFAKSQGAGDVPGLLASRPPLWQPSVPDRTSDGRRRGGAAQTPAPRSGSRKHAQVGRAVGPVPVAGGGDELTVLADSEGRRGDLSEAAFLEVIGADC